MKEIDTIPKPTTTIFFLPFPCEPVFALVLALPSTGSPYRILSSTGMLSGLLGMVHVLAEAGLKALRCF